MTLRSKLLAFAALILIIIVAACSPQADTTALQPSETPLGPRVPTRVPTATATSTPTITPTASDTPTPSDTPTATATPRSPEEAQALVVEGNNVFALGNYSLAMSNYLEAIEIDPTNANAHVGAGRVYHQRGEYDRAITYFDQAIELQPDNADFHVYRGITRAAQDDGEGAMADYDRAIELDGSNEVAFTQRAMVHEAAGNTEQAIADYSSAIDANPRYIAAYEGRGLLYTQQEDYVNAVADLRTYLRLAGPAADAGVVETLRGAEISRAVVLAETGEAEQITFGGVGIGRVNNETPIIVYSFEAEADAVVTIQMTATSGTLDPALALLDSSGAPIITNDDDPVRGTSDAVLRDITIPADGTYIILATRSDDVTGVTSGEYRLTLRQPVETTIAYDESVVGDIDNATPQIEYTFEAQEGDRITIQMDTTDGELDPMILLLDPAGVQIAFNDDDPSSDTGNALLQNFEIPADGVYTIVATRFRRESGTSSGSFILRLMLSEEVAAPTPTPAPPPPPGNAITYGQAVRGTISNSNPRMTFNLVAQAGDVINIRMTAISGNLDTLIILESDTGAELAQNDDDPTRAGTDSFLREFTIPADGVYRIVATRFRAENGTTTGDFAMVVELVRQSTSGIIATQGSNAGGPIGVGETASSQINDDAWEHRYTFAAQPGNVINIRMVATGGNLEPVVILLDGGGNELIRNGTASGGVGATASILRYRIAAAGDYTIVVTRSGGAPGTTSGSFTLALSAGS